MTRPVLRILLTILMYSGVAVCLLPYLRGQLTTGIPFLIVGIGISLVCGFLRCYLTEGDCTEKHLTATSHKQT